MIVPEEKAKERLMEGTLGGVVRTKGSSEGLPYLWAKALRKKHNRALEQPSG
jgi:hypothetical protein